MCTWHIPHQWFNIGLHCSVPEIITNYFCFIAQNTGLLLHHGPQMKVAAQKMPIDRLFRTVEWRRRASSSRRALLNHPGNYGAFCWRFCCAWNRASHHQHWRTGYPLILYERRRSPALQTADAQEVALLMRRSSIGPNTKQRFRQFFKRSISSANRKAMKWSRKKSSMSIILITLLWIKERPSSVQRHHCHLWNI